MSTQQNHFAEIEFLKIATKNDENKIFSHFNIQNGIDEIHVKYHHALGKILGRSNDYSDNGILKSKFDFDKGDFILLSFKSYKGQIPANVEIAGVLENRIQRRRFNLYRKGKIWSESDLHYGKYFYYFLDKLNDAFHETPINLLSYCVHTYVKSSSPFHLEISQDYNYAQENNCIYFPSESDLRSIKNDSLDEVLNIFKEHLKLDFLKHPNFDEIEKSEKKLASAKHLISELVVSDLFSKCINQFCKVFSIQKTQLNGKLSFDQTLKEKIFYSSILYSYNHLPYNLHLFFPSTNDVHIDNLFTIMVAKENSNELVVDDKTLFLNLVSASPNIPQYEFDLNKKASENTESLIRWKYIYEQNLDSYSTFMHAAENICITICKHYEIKATVSARLKTFGSFYNKIIDRANQGEMLENDFSYKDAIYKPDELKDFVFKDIRDIAGVRIVCVFDDDVWYLDKIFESEIEKSDLVCSYFKRYKQNRKDIDDPKHNPNEYNYRGFHVSIIPGMKRLELIEYKDIEFVQCEVQIRTNFAHGWSDVEHPMVYKDKLHLEVIDSRFNDEMKEKLQVISKALKNHDEEIAALKQKRSNYKFPVTE